MNQAQDKAEQYVSSLPDPESVPDVVRSAFVAGYEAALRDVLRTFKDLREKAEARHREAADSLERSIP